MSIFKVITKKDQDLNDLYSRCIYITDCRSTKLDLIYGSNINIHFPFNSMILVKKIFNQENGHTYHHFVLSVDTSDTVDPYTFYVLSVQVCELIAYFGGNYQVLMAVHINTDNLHTHFICNNIDFLTGKRMNVNYSMLHGIKENINLILENYDLSTIHMNY